MALYPLKFEPIYKAKVWGGRTLERLGRSLPGGAEEKIGESWELADLGATDPSGGGGAAARSKLDNGLLRGATLHDLLQRMPGTVLGDLPLNECGEFPLLCKFLDARQNLSVQVHPDETYVRAHPEAHLKSEAWYIVDAEPGAVIYKGVKEGVTSGRFREAIEAGELEPLLNKVEARPGDCHYLPSGTCHALGAGIVVAEVQTPSDTTFRVYDWGREGRELHVEPALECIRFAPPETEANEPGTERQRDGAVVRTLVDCPYFWIERVTAEAGAEPRVETGGRPRVWMVLSGGGELTCKNAGCDRVPFGPMETVLLPAVMDRAGGRFTERTVYLEVTFPG